MTSNVRSVVVRRAHHEGFALDAAQRDLLAGLAAFVARREHSDLTADEPAGWYVHGPAGRGKTWLMQAVFDALPVDASRKRRVHFHSFFHELQHRFGTHVSARAAIDATVDELFEGIDWLMFDELHVHDPAGAALLNRVLAELDRRGIAALVSSNYEPDGLLPDPVTHHVFQPGIDLITRRFHVAVLDGGTDYRVAQVGRDAGFASGRWIVAEDSAVPGTLEAPNAVGLVAPRADEATQVTSGHYAFDALAVRDREVWFDFTALFGSHTTASDFVAWAQRFDRWVITGTVGLRNVGTMPQQRLVWLLDVLADADVKLDVVSSHRRDDFLVVDEATPDLFRAASRLRLLREVEAAAPLAVTRVDSMQA